MAAALWFLYELFVQQGSTLLRLEALDQRVTPQAISLEDRSARRARLISRFEVGNRFEAGILRDIVMLDEYRLADRRFESEDIVVDIGAHIGIFSYLCYIQGSRAIYSYEPSERNF